MRPRHSRRALGPALAAGIALSAAAIGFTAAGCSATKLRVHATGLPLPWCKPGDARSSIAVYWGTAWRADQKEAAEREAIADATISRFFATNPCYETLVVARTVRDRSALLLSDEEIVAAAQAAAGDVDQVAVIRIEELGPNLRLYVSPILWSTENEVQLNARLLDPRTGWLDGDVSIARLRGGAFTFNGTGELCADLWGALGEVFGGDRAPDSHPGRPLEGAPATRR